MTLICLKEVKALTFIRCFLFECYSVTLTCVEEVKLRHLFEVAVKIAPYSLFYFFMSMKEECALK